MANERYTQQVQPSLGERAVGTGKAVMEKGSEFIRHADEAVDMAPPAAAVWLAVVVGLAAYKVVSSVGKNIGPRDGAARLVRGAAYICAAWMAGSCAHDNFLESKGYTVNGSQPSYQQIQSSPRAADFDKAAKPYKRTYDYAPRYSDAPVSADRADGAPGSGRVREAPSSYRGRDVTPQVTPEVLPADRRHNKPIARPE